jgi:NAD(P)-dependent dehydrogenase (short-subunit alcohol dehydrogenase family)
MTCLRRRAGTRTVFVGEMDVSDHASVDVAVTAVLAEAGRIDVVIHNAGHMVLGPTEAFTPEQVAAVYDTNVLSTQRVNRAVLPAMRAQRDGLVLWVGSSSSRGGTPPYLGPYFAAKAAEDALAVSYAAELTRFGIETTIIVPGSFTSGTNHFANAGKPADKYIARAYEAEYSGLMDEVSMKLAELAPNDADPSEVAGQIVKSLTRRRVHARSGCTSILPTMVPRTCSGWATGCASGSTSGSGYWICSALTVQRHGNRLASDHLHEHAIAVLDLLTTGFPVPRPPVRSSKLSSKS